MRVGVLALQGAFREHEERLRRLGIDVVEVRRPQQLAECAGLILPGGESTAMRKVANEGGLLGPLRDYALAGRPVWGTCAGMILVANDIGPESPHLALLDVSVRRNGFGRQADSFEVALAVRWPPGSEEGQDQSPFPAVFIRAPFIERAGPAVQILATLDDGRIVAAQEGRVLATSFHPELTEDDRFHRYFVRMVRDAD